MKKHTVAASLAALLANAAGAATIGDEGYLRLIQTARADGAAAVVVHLAPVSLRQLAADRVGIRAALERQGQALVAELGDAVEDGGRWTSPLGQIGLHLTESGLMRLRQSNNAVSFWPDDRGLRRKNLAVDEAMHESIRSRLKRDGFVDVEVVWHVAGLEYDIDGDGRPRVRMNEAQRATARAKAARLLSRLGDRQLPDRAIAASKALETMNSQPDAPTVLRVTRQGLSALLDDDGVRIVRALGQQTPKTRRVDNKTLALAEQAGSAEVIVTLADPMLTPDLDLVSDQERVKANQRAFDALLAIAGGASQVRSYPALGTMVARISPKALRALDSQADGRLLAMELNRPVATASTNVSVPSMNIPQVWALGYKGANQMIAVLDTGIYAAHPMFKNAAGQSRILAEGCYGTTAVSNGVAWKSVCPQANASGDSPEWTTGAAVAVAGCSSVSAAVCNHGTHVAGIAVGTKTSAAQGVAPEAQIVPIQVFSYDSAKQRAPTVFVADLLAALQMAYRYTTVGQPNPLTINMSLGSSYPNLYSTPQACVTANPAWATAIANLVARNVPVIVAMGNDGYKDRLSAPACLPGAVKVGALSNDGQLTTEASFSNRPVLGNFPGEAFFFAPGGQSITPETYVISAYDSSILHVGMAGTSQAAPHITGLYALFKAAVPTATNADIANWLIANSPRTINGIPVVRLPNL
ncbi:MAG: S8 family serine peptidase [Sterolibacterium sp.]|nr:S8 family serine peptidase [Sterolibacterium sp.]